MTLFQNFVWILLFMLGQGTRGANAYEKCSTSSDCEHLLSKEDVENPAINGVCTENIVRGTCIITYDYVPSVGYCAKAKDPIAPGCTKLNSTWVKICEKAAEEFRQKYAAYSQKIVNAYACKDTTVKEKNVIALACSSQLASKVAHDKCVTKTKSKSGCNTPTDCEKILSEDDQKNHGIFKICFNSEQGCQAPKSCDHACAFGYSKVLGANEAARNPNPGKCKIPPASQKAMVDKICDDFLNLQLNPKIAPDLKNTLYTPKGFICGPKNYTSCVVQLEPK